jgi:membrane protein DedA with SNARE-associated domain
MPPVIRIVGHLVPEELFMITMGVIAAGCESPRQAVALLSVVLASHLVTDQVVYLGGCWLRDRLQRFPRARGPIEKVTSRLTSSPGAILGLIPGRVLPLGRAAWLAGCGVVGVPWRLFVAVDLAALLVHLGTWSGLGWWLAGDLSRLAVSAQVGRMLAVWVVVTLICAISAVLVWRWRPSWQPVTGRAMRRAGRSFRWLF